MTIEAQAEKRRKANTPSGTSAEKHSVARKAGLLQVAATIFFGLFAIGKKGTWQKDGATVSLPQVIAGALVALVVVLILLIAIVQLAIK